MTNREKFKDELVEFRDVAYDILMLKGIDKAMSKYYMLLGDTDD